MEVFMERINEKEDFLDKIEGHADILRMLSLDRLKILNDYYDEDIKKRKEKIKELKSKL